LPPRWLRDVGPSDFEATGREFLDLFIRLGQLKPDEQLLDIGCGCGRMAIPLTGYLNRQGSYVGLDITAAPISWCQENITPQHPNFRFAHMDLYNQRYNPAGGQLARDYTFPFEAERFDFIFLTSVFTHMLPADVEHYLSEIARLLRSNGRVFITVFLLNETQQTLAQQGRNDINFQYGAGSYRTRNEAVPESAVAYDEAFFQQLIARAGLLISQPVYYGRWSGRKDGLSYQDILLLSRRTGQPNLL
jgi:ubiquinone/menaquinone biosynthesis C-methylase UbiE